VDAALFAMRSPLSIRANAKGDALIPALREALQQAEALGAQRKAVVFTESRRTQQYLFDLLSANGYDGQLVMMNSANLIHAQMQDHYKESATEYEVRVSKGFTLMRASSFSMAAGEAQRDFRAPVDERQMVRGMLFGGFKKCLYRWPQRPASSNPARRPLLPSNAVALGIRSRRSS
jgi:hypothetical protein